ncbi:hypothetical protein FXV91_18590 [Methanosarcina sp. DH2]|uniref:hypothetical protein n=1 Tax=Methanosarcina sp. DH2 TaxID=2605639 RepID=UPI001E3042AA|nr:hypothetical protein [Methanosarcina sp. DH2]MCC4772098.1 hypothetical protein [Methanosarcina sp. DH2]
MDKQDSKKSALDHFRSLWSSLPEIIKLVGTILGIALALKALFPAAAMGINSFDAGPEVIEPGELSVLSWEVSGATNVTIEPDLGAVNSSGSLPVSPSETTIYKLIASDEGKEKVATCTVTVEEEDLLISSFDASPDSIQPGENSVLSWHVAGVSNVTIEPGIGIVEPAGTLNVSPADTTSYELTASNGDKEDTAYCTVTVEGSPLPPKDNLTSAEENILPSNENLSGPKEYLPSEDLPSEDLPSEDLPSIVSFNADSDVIAKGESSNLTWSVSKATEIAIEPGIGTAGLTGSQRIFPEETTTYTLTATNKEGSVSATKVIFVEEPSMLTPSVPISTPEQVSPASGEVFDTSTAQAVLKWKAVSGAANYTVEIDSYDSSTGMWLSETSGSRVVSGISGTSYSFEFLEGTGQYRWRIWAMSSEGRESDKSGWWNFSHPLNLSPEPGDTSST